MKFLSVLGKVLLTTAKVATGLGPLVPTLVPQAGKYMDTVEKLASIVVSAEAFGQVNGLDGIAKLKGATPLVSQLILQSDMLVGKKINDPELFNRGCIQLTSGMADILNSLKTDGLG